MNSLKSYPYVKVCLHVHFCSSYPLLSPFKFSVVPKVAMLSDGTEWVTDSFCLYYSDGNKKNIFSNSSSNGHGLKPLRVNRHQ